MSARKSAACILLIALAMFVIGLGLGLHFIAP